MTRVASVASDGATWYVTAQGELYPVAGFTTQAAAVQWARRRGYRVDYDAPKESAVAYAKRVAIWAAIGIPVFWWLCGTVGGL